MDIIKEKLRKILTDKKNIWRAVAVLLIFLYSFILIYCCEALSRGTIAGMWDFIGNSPTTAIFVNCAVLAAFAILFLWLITTKLAVSVGLVSIFLFVMHLINYLKTSMRSEPFFPWDIKLAGEAANIIGDMNVTIIPVMAWSAAFIILSIIACIFADVFLKKFVSIKYRFAAPIAIVPLILFLVFAGVWFSPSYEANHGISPSMYQQNENYENYGFIYSFVFNYKNAQVDAPVIKETDGITGILSEAGIDSTHKLCTDEDIKVKDPNIIIVMSEAFIDIGESENLDFGKEILPNFTSLSENYLSGRLITPQFGGGTSNSEFEVLTGFSNYFLPSGTIAYTNYVERETDSVVSFLDSEGYKTLALHPYIRDFFSRDKAYEFLGFSEYLSEESFAGYETKRWYNFTSDAALTKKIIEQYEKNKESGKPFFNLSVSMQNHAGYGKDEFPEEMLDCEINAELTEAESAAVVSYASGTALTDAALGELVDYFENCEEPTVIVFFGDHVPYLGEGTDKTLDEIGYLDGLGNAESNLRLYSTPYVVWNNFEETPTVKNENMSMFYLMPYVTRTLGLDRPNYYYFLDSLYAKFRGITPKICLDFEGTPLLQPTEEMKKYIEKLEAVQYDLLLGDKETEEYLY